jgi:hypothetical protein
MKTLTCVPGWDLQEVLSSIVPGLVQNEIQLGRWLELREEALGSSRGHSAQLGHVPTAHSGSTGATMSWDGSCTCQVPPSPSKLKAFYPSLGWTIQLCGMVSKAFVSWLTSPGHPKFSSLTITRCVLGECKSI